MKRKRAGKGDKRKFSKGAMKEHKKNSFAPRGGFRL